MSIRCSTRISPVCQQKKKYVEALKLTVNKNNIRNNNVRSFGVVKT